MNKQQLSYNRPYINNNDRIANNRWLKFEVENTHHPACRSRVEQWSEEITIQLFETLHSAYHRVFGNGLLQENLSQLVNINGRVLSDKFKKDLHELISMDDNYVYKDWIRIKR